MSCGVPTCCSGTSGKRFRLLSVAEGVDAEVVLGFGCCVDFPSFSSLWGLSFCRWGLEVDSLVWTEKVTAALREGDIPMMMEAVRDNGALDFLTLGGDKGERSCGETLFKSSSRTALNTLIVRLSPGVAVGWALPPPDPQLGLVLVSGSEDPRSSSFAFSCVKRLFL